MKKIAEEENLALIGPLAKRSFFDLDKNAKHSDKEQQGQERAEPDCQHSQGTGHFSLTVFASSLVEENVFKILLFLDYVYGCFACPNMCVSYMCLVLSKAQEDIKILWN